MVTAVINSKSQHFKFFLRLTTSPSPPPLIPPNIIIKHQKAGIALRNAKAFRTQTLVQRKLRSVTDLVRSLQQPDMGVNSLIFTMTAKVVGKEKKSVCCVVRVERIIAKTKN
jgi:hypothetical protein